MMACLLCFVGALASARGVNKSQCFKATQCPASAKPLAKRPYSLQKRDTERKGEKEYKEVAGYRSSNNSSWT